ncbi:MAG: T9SS type A sorting domain-containing protein [candidate division Zixibacteria bacterium]|nr:T9SS type A sorting domain-containing protein [candidate division Zixibacteria bacterium]
MDISLPVSGTDVDGNLTGCTIKSGPGQLVDGLWTYTPTGDETVTVTIECTDECGAACESSFTVSFDKNQPPAVACVDFLEPVFVCDLNNEICVNGFGAIDEDGNLDTMWVTVNGVDYPVVDNGICFVPTEGSNNMILYAVDDCGDTSWCDAVVEVIVNSAPTCLLPDDTTLFICDQVELCFDLVAEDIDGNLSGWELISGPGAINGDQWCYDATTSETVTVTVRGLDSCGAYCEKTFTATIQANRAPEVVCPEFPDPIFVCDLSEICLDGFVASDPDGNLDSVVVTVNAIVVPSDQGRICFTPQEGPNHITFSALDSCGAVSRCETMVVVALNSQPTCIVPDDTTIFLCDLTEITLPVTAADIDGNLVACTIVDGPGQIVNGMWTYTPGGDETVTVTVQCTDECGATCESSFTVDFSLNKPPVVACGDFFEPMFLCELEEICLNAFGAIDPDDNLESVWVTVNGADYPVVEGSICFVPVEGTNLMTLYAVDACGDTSACGTSVDIVLNTAPTCLMPTDTTLWNCGPVQLCLPLMAEDTDGNFSGWELISGPGSIVDSSWCYTPQGTETVSVVARALDSCGAYCDQTFSVTFDLNSPPELTCPDDTTIAACNNSVICIGDFLVVDPDDNLETVTATLNGQPITMTGATICFTPIDGDNVLSVTAIDACGAEASCETNVTVNINEPPVCYPPNDTAIALCEPEEICLPVSAFDPDGNFDHCEVVSGVGEIVDGYWCFTPDKAIGGVITIRCFDSCGAYCETEFTVDIELNEPPIIYDRGIAAALCEIGQVREVGAIGFDPDGDPLTFILLDGPGTINSETGLITYYPDTSGVYTFEVAAYDTCAGDTGFVWDTISINTPPELITFDSTIQVCGIAQEICFDVIGSDPDGDVITITQESGPGVFTILTDSSGQTCFMPEDVDSATYVFTYCVTDPCTGAKITSEICPECPPCIPDTIRITVLRNRPPVVVCPDPQRFSICEPETLCFDFNPGDPELQQLSVNILSGNAVYDNGSICFDAVGSDQFDIVIEVVDDCDASDTCIVPVTIEGNYAPVVSSADDFEKFLCEPSEICFDVAVSDIDQDIATITTSFGTYNPDTDQLCFYADTAGSYIIIVTATDSCGASTSDTTTVTVELNEAPYVDAGDDFEIGLCGLTQVCFDLTVGDPDGNLVTILSSMGTYDPLTGQVCFDVEYDGTYELIIEATDECDVTAVDTVHVTVTSGAPPFVDLGADLDLGQCEPREVCVDVNTIDVFQSLTTTLGVYNETTSQICFTPEGGGEYTMIVTVVDSCDQMAADTVNILVGTNRPPIATGMPDSTVYLCYPQTICLPIEISDPDGNIQSINVTGGSYNDGQVCFTPYDSGTFEIIATVTDSCGETDADTAYVTIRTDQGIQIVCPNDTTIFTCVGDTFCLPIGGIPEIAEVNVTGINTWFDEELQSICFYSECGNTNNVTVEVTTPCGSHSCSFTVVIECNHDPLVLLPPDTTMMFCGSSEVCVPVGVYDPDGNLVDVTVEGGLYDPLHGQVCFNADTAGEYTIVVTAIDECGELDSDSINVTIEFNTPPVIIYEWADSVIATCVPEVCVPISFGDAEDNLVEVLTDVGYYDESTGEICFVAETSGQYCVSVIAIDDCDLADTLNACVTVDIGEYVQITCPEDTVQAEPICGPETVCVPLDIIGNNYTITTSFGSYAEGELCFQADTAGIYEITVIGTADCNSDTCDILVKVIIPDEATIACPADTAQLFCGPDTLCFDFTVSAATTSVAVSEPAYLSEGMVCVPVLEPGTIEVTMIASSNCNADTCAFTVTATFNSPPSVVTGPDTTLTVCEPYEVCIPFTADDPDDNIIEISSTHGDIIDNEVCFTPDGFGIHEVIVSVRDACGEAAYDTTFVNVLSGGSPLIVCPPTTVFDTLCGPDSICITMPISPANAEVTISPNGSYNPQTGAICVYIDQTGLYSIMVTAEAQCGIDTCVFDLDVQIPEAPVVSCPSNVDTLLCLTEPVELCYPVSATGTDITISVSSPAVYSNGQVCLPIEEPGTHEVTVIATGRCEADTCTTTINVTADQPPELFLPQETLTFDRCIDDTTLICIDGIYATDLEGGFTLSQVCGPGDFELVTDDSGRVCFLPDAFGLIEFCFEVDDGCNITDGSFWVDIQELPDCDVCVRMSLNSHECTPVGLIKTVDLMIEAREYLGGFDVLLAYDASVMAFTFATIEGSAVDGWEYFEYRIGAADCGQSCPSGLIRFVGIADINNGPHHPPPDSRLPHGVLVEMQYQVANDQNLGDQFLPINFAWYSCADNAFSDTSGNDLFVDVRILNAEGGMIWDELDDVNYPEESRPFGLGTRDECFGGGKVDPIRCVEFINGGICVIHPDSIDDRGDINLNGVPYEIADAVVFSNYFIHGLVVFVENLAGQIAATDVNADGVTLSVADLVLLIRVIVGDADPIPKLNPYPEDLIVSTEALDGRLNISTDAVSNIGAAYFVFDVEPGTEIEQPSLAGAADDMDLLYTVVDGELRVLIYNLGTNRIEAGEHSLIEIPFSGEAGPILKSQEIVDYHGRPYNCVGKGGALPTDFGLSQNYPNPFNPATTISFSTPQATAWTLRIYNVTGALVRSFEGQANAGHQSVTWDGLDSHGSASASGVYFYRLDAGSFNDTKKMILLK